MTKNNIQNVDSEINMETKISVRGLYKVFGKNSQKALQLRKEGASKDEILKKTKATVGVDNVSFDIKQGELFVIMGLSGSGKSTILRCLNHLIKPTSGKIVVDGSDISKFSGKEMREFRQNHMAMVFQQFALLPHKTVLQNANWGLEIKGVSKQERLEEARHALELVGLKGWEDKYPEELSGGMKQRVGLARALASKTSILLMDEAFSALDPLIREEMQDLLLEILSVTKKTVVFITHDLNEALKLGDNISFLKDGELIQVGTPEDIINTPADEYVEKFVQGVDRAKILTTGDVMKKAKPFIRVQDGPSLALRVMKEYGISSVFAVDKNIKFKGIVTVDDALEAKKNNVKSFESLELTQPKVVYDDVPLNEIMGTIAESSLPIAVTNRDDKFLGIIVRGSVLAALDPNSKGEENE